MKNLQVQREFLKYAGDTALPGFKKGNMEYGNLLQAIFLFPEEEKLHIEIAEAYADVLLHIPAKKLIRLSEGFRRHFYDGWYILDYGIEWRDAALAREDFPYLTDNQYGAMLKLGTFMDNGYYRERCIKALDGFEGALPFFILRLNDWVAQVRESAFLLAKKRLPACSIPELFASLPALEKVKASGRRSDGDFWFIEKLANKMMFQKFNHMTENMLYEIPGYEINIKNAIYRLASQYHILKREQMETLLQIEKTGYGKRLLILGIFRHYGYEQAQIGRYLLSKSAVVRYYALMYRYDREHGAWEGLSGMLLDKSKRIRENASYILKKHTGMDILGFYLKKLPGQVSRIVLLGIGEHGTKEETGIIMPFLESGDEQVARAAFKVYGKLAMESGDVEYWRFLFDHRPLLAGVAYHTIRKYGIHYGASRLYQAFLQNQGTVLGGYLLNLLLCEPSWERLPYLLALYGDAGLPDACNASILAGIKNRYAYGEISARQAEKILAVLGQAALVPDEEKKAILFDLKYVVKG